MGCASYLNQRKTAGIHRPQSLTMVYAVNASPPPAGWGVLAGSVTVDRFVVRRITFPGDSKPSRSGSILEIRNTALACFDVDLVKTTACRDSFVPGFEGTIGSRNAGNAKLCGLLSFIRGTRWASRRGNIRDEASVSWILGY
jgi:hypothetical protein